MKEGKASRTAEETAAARSFESMRSEDKRVCYDAYAKDFLGGIFSLLAKSRRLITTQLLLSMAFWFGDRMNPGGAGYTVGRTAYIDDYLRECIDGGIEQLVIIGAGYDSRAYRFDELKGKVTVFEVDHPDTQRVKMEKVKRILGSLPEHVVYVPIDFDKEKLDEKLFESGYNNTLKTLFIWEGVTLYITAEAVDETVAFVVNNSGKGSSIIFDYALQSAMDGRMEGTEKWRRYAERRGETYIFGIEEGTIEQFLSQRGFCQVESATGESLKDVYFKGKNRDRKVLPFLSIVHATVKRREGS